MAGEEEHHFWHAGGEHTHTHTPRASRKEGQGTLFSSPLYAGRLAPCKRREYHTPPHTCIFPPIPFSIISGWLAGAGSGSETHPIICETVSPTLPACWTSFCMHGWPCLAVAFPSWWGRGLKAGSGKPAHYLPSNTKENNGVGGKQGHFGLAFLHLPFALALYLCLLPFTFDIYLAFAFIYLIYS